MRSSCHRCAARVDRGQVGRAAQIDMVEMMEIVEASVELGCRTGAEPERSVPSSFYSL
jgi:ferredoxin